MVVCCGRKISRCPILVFLDFMHSSLDVPFPSAREATIALRSLAPDREPRKGGISKQLSVSGSTLSVWERLLEYNHYIERKIILPYAKPCRLCVSGGGVQMKPGSSECPSPRLWIICRSCWKPWRCSDPQFPTEAWLMIQDTYLFIIPLILHEDLTQVRHLVENTRNCLICSSWTAARTM